MIASILGAIDEWIGGFFNIVWAILCVPVYSCIRTIFNIFIRIAELDILSDADMSGIYKRVTMIITIVMTFYVVFSIVKYTISPDTISDKEKGVGKIAYRIIIAILLVAFVPEIFSMAYKIQNRLISSQVFSKVILGQDAWDYSTYGSSFAADTFSAFYRVDQDHCGNQCAKAEEHVSNIIEDIRQGGSTIHIIRTIGGQTGLSLFGDSVSPSAVEFDGLFALIFGCFTVYVLFLYCIDVATRYIQLLYLQIIAPIAILSYIVPSKDNMFNKWVKQSLTTYLDLFIRISIMYFAILILKTLAHSMKIYTLTSDGKHIGVFVYIFFIMGVLVFVQRAPKLLAELFPSSGAAGIGFGFSWKTRQEPLKKSIDTIKKPIAATAGAVASTISSYKSLKNGKLKAALDSKYGEKGKDKAKDRRRNLQAAYILARSARGGGRDAAKSNRISSAYTNRDRQEREAFNILDNVGTPIGHDVFGLYYENKRDKFKQYLDGMDAILKSRKTAKDSGADLKTNKAAQSYAADWTEKGLGDPNARNQFIKDIDKAMNIYAMSARSTTDKATAKAAIVAAIDKTKIYSFNESEYRLKLQSEGVTDTAEIDARVIAEQQRMANERQAAIDSFIGNSTRGIEGQFEKDQNSAEILIQNNNLEEAMKITRSVRDTDGKLMKIMVTVDDFGVEREVDFNQWAAAHSSTPAEIAHVKQQFAKHFGDIEKYVSNASVETQYSAEYKEAKANANAPGKKDDDKK